MGTKISLTFWHEDDAVAEEARARAMEEFHRIDQALSPYKKTSELSQANRLAAKETLSISNELVFLIDKSLYYGGKSEGAFDITFASVGRYYDYRKNQQPDSQLRKAMLPAINYNHVKLDRRKKTLSFAHPLVYIDLGGIAKGYAVDRAIQVLMSLGVKHAAVSAGGDSRILGDKRGKPWMIGVKNPRQSKGQPESLIRIPLSDAAVSTSGDYERFFIDPLTGERVHHILNPKTGSPTKGIVSVTVIGSLGVDTDPLSTTVFVLGVKKGLALIESFPGIDCIIIDSKGNAHYSAGLIEPTVK